MAQIYTDIDGPGSFEDMIEYVEQVLRQSFAVIPEKDMTVEPNNQYKRRARNIVMSLMSRQNIFILEKTAEWIVDAETRVREVIRQLHSISVDGQHAELDYDLDLCYSIVETPYKSVLYKASIDGFYYGVAYEDLGIGDPDVKITRSEVFLQPTE